jgi:hypothetical protein
MLYSGWALDDTSYYLWLLKYKPFFYLFNSWSGTGDRLFPIFLPIYQLLSYISFSHKLFFLYHFISASAIVCIMYKIFKGLNLNFKYIIIFILFVPGFTDSFYQIVNEEKEILLFWVLLLSMIVFVQYHEGNIIKKNIVVLTYPLLAIIPIFMKETSCILSLTFSGSLFALSSKPISRQLYKVGEKFNLKKETKYFLLFSIVWSILFLVLFYIFTSQDSPESYLIQMNPADSLIGHINASTKSLILYAISDPLLVLLLPILFLYSIYQRIIQKRVIFAKNFINYAVFIDACAISALTFVLAYIVLGFSGYRYLLPAYPFGLIALAGYLDVYIPLMKKNIKSLYINIPIVLIIFLWGNSVFSAVNIAVFNKVSSYNFMKYKDALIHKIDDINSIENTKVNFYLPGKKDIGYIADRHRDILNFYEVNIHSVNFEFNPINQNWLERGKKGDIENLVQKGDLFLITPNSTISKDKIMANLKGLQLHEIMRTQSPYYFEIPEIRHMLKYTMLKKNPNALGSQMIYREVDYAIYEVL